MKNITWDDLVFNPKEYDIQEVYSDWTWLLNGQIKPLMISQFGDMFFQRKDGKVCFLDMMEGEIVDICPSEESFIEFINQKENIEDYLFSDLIFSLKNSGKIPNKDECFIFTIPPVLGGQISVDNVSIMSFKVVVSLAGQLHRQI